MKAENFQEQKSYRFLPQWDSHCGLSLKLGCTSFGCAWSFGGLMAFLLATEHVLSVGPIRFATSNWPSEMRACLGAVGVILLIAGVPLLHGTWAKEAALLRPFVIINIIFMSMAVSGLVSGTTFLCMAEPPQTNTEDIGMLDLSENIAFLFLISSSVFIICWYQASIVNSYYHVLKSPSQYRSPKSSSSPYYIKV